MSSNFADEVGFEVKAGDGGNGAVAFRHEKFVPRGGPDGGDGGAGGSVYILADHNLNTLADLTRQKIYRANNGRPGAKQKSAGKSGADLILKVPVGTQVFEVESVRGKLKEFLIADLERSGDKFRVAQGGGGGYGNARFARANFQSPRFAELGEPGEERTVILKLKIVADVGLIGLPNAGKSTLLSVISNARPKIADYEFTTLIPNLGIVKLSDKSFVVADIPGLIEGASTGKGLGCQFLRHIERTKILVHLIDATRPEPVKDFRLINAEMKKFSKELGHKPQLVVLNKMDAVRADRLKQLGEMRFGGNPIFFVSAAAHKGITGLLHAMAAALPKVRRQIAGGEVFKTFTLRDLPYVRFEVAKKTGYFIIKGPKQERLAIKTDFGNPQAFARFQKVLKRMGVLGALKKAGAKLGNKVKIGKKQFEFEDI
ncbi:MAG: GTPase ObgE [bacterium]